MSNREQKLEAALGTVLDQVDYNAGACGLTEMVGACLPVEVIDLARKALAPTSTEPPQKIADVPTGMRRVDECPTTGQFVVMWVYNNTLWSYTYQWDGDTLQRYNEVDGEFEYRDTEVNIDGEDFSTFPIGDNDIHQKMYFVAE